MSKITLSERLRYGFDTFMARGTVALIGGLALTCLAFIFLMGLLLSITGVAPEGSDRLNPLEAVWSVLMRTLDAGTMGGDTGWLFRFAMLFVTFGGIFLISTLIGVLSSGIDTKLEDLRKGRSRVVETDHIVILGWSLQVFTLISELTLANANRPGTCIVILSQEDKVQMEDTLSSILGKRPKIRLVCRTGSPSNITDLGMVNVQTARSIVILSSSNTHADIQLVKTLLAITSIPRSVSQPYHIVAQVQDPKSSDIVSLIGRKDIEVLLTNDLISRIIVQTCRQSGLSTVYMELLDFGGNEIYIKAEPNLQGKTYGDALVAYNESAVLGIKYSNGTIQLNPPIDTPLPPNEQLVLISEDDSTIHLSPLSDIPIDRQAIQVKETNAIQIPENTLILGWNNRVSSIIQLLDYYVALGSSVTVVAEFPDVEVDLSPESLNLQQQTVRCYQGNPTERRVLESIDLAKYDRVLVLCNLDLEPELADAQTLITLLYLRNISDRQKCNFQVVTEILDLRNQALAQVTRPDDFVISEQIVSRLLAQVSEQKSLNAVFCDLFDPEGSEIYIKPVSEYVALDHPVNFYTVVEAAKQRGESAIGYRCKADANNSGRAYGVTINPKKDRLITFALQDTIIVLAEK